ncbi:hypothetical protein [Tritonibacter mobilis]|uniref:hypothetical protein n=1 Tax=Tritonibacter mobilis TaxID=379347 RepID=UPI003A5BAF39
MSEKNQQSADLMARQYFLHLGAHRTGSSSFQLCLHENRAALANAGYGVAFPARDGIRAGQLALRLPQPRHDAEAETRMAETARQHLTQDIAPAPDQKVLLSEENILGSMSHFQQALFYPASAKRLRALRQAMEGPAAAVLLVVRDYGPFFRSCIRKRMEETIVTDFEGAVSAYLAMDRGWLEVLREVRDILEPAKLIVARHEDRPKRVDLLRELAPDLAQVALMQPSTSLNISATDRALSALQARYATGEKLSRKAWRATLAEWRDDTTPLGLTEFTPRELRAFSMRYERDLSDIAKEPGLTLI